MPSVIVERENDIEIVAVGSQLELFEYIHSICFPFDVYKYSMIKFCV